MSYRVDTNLLSELKEYGDVNIEACFNCGNCTAICPLTDDGHTFPRNMIRLVQMGLKDRLLQSTDPWLCYYCGDCSQTCPKKAEPAEAMMSIRRWMTAEYDQSGHGAKFYKSEKAVLKASFLYALIPLVLLLIYHAVTGFRHIDTDQVALNAFAPVLWVWAVVLIDFALLGSRLLSSVIRMFRLVMRPNESTYKIPLSVYLQELKTLVVHTLTQKRWLDCGENRSRWLKHLLMISGYGIMLVLVVGLLLWFQTDNLYPLYHPQRWLGYYATFVLLIFSGEALISRIRKREEIHRFSHASDWLFPAFLFVGTLTGILVHIFRYAAWPWPTYILYTIHVMVMIAMLDTEVGIGKWTHLIYRPLAVYLDAVKERALEQQAVPDLASAGAD
ncbi:MAG: 4Fe-4S dicluster domain-containing protein [Anaerolineales bacterium]|nr:4Fe-4S dicluster domain-containing protein [Anaerolineales bacterium]